MTTNYTLNREQYLSFLTAHRKLANERTLSSLSIITYNLIRDLPLSRGFSPITNTVKLANGATANAAYESALSTLKWMLAKHPDRMQKYYGETVLTIDVIAALRAKLEAL